MNRIDKKFKELKKRRKKAFVAFIMAGDPSIAITKKLVFELERQGADIIELGVAFSDPLADGPAIQRSSERALKKKVNLDVVCRLVKEIRQKTQIPIAFLTYYNLLYHYGLERFAEKAKSSGVDGVIVPDLPPEESGELRRIAKKKGFSLIHLLAPTSSRQRIKMIANTSTGFIYYVSLTGTTGVRKELPKELSSSLRLIKRLTKKPVCVGFGISTPQQVKAVSRLTDGVIVGSAIIKMIEKNIGKQRLVENVGKFVRRLTCML
ncbi:MAG: tryptophan synthase subunit alpha [Candidatus Omnitrophica bacterium]|nr:tryptophan synthase subunit alpha [Candidatus Omnitrophota bacterium]MBU4457511.1 tryptophan synthase subunit alpha [Candidatus Omnitrophota bacterium]